MASSEAMIERSIADEARKDLERHNQRLIAESTHESASPIVLLEASSELANLRLACESFRKVYEADHPSQRITWRASVLCTRRPLSEPPTFTESYGCLALGRIGGGDTAELKTGCALIWEPGQKHEFGAAGCVYIGFKIEERNEGATKAKDN